MVVPSAPAEDSAPEVRSPRSRMGSMRSTRYICVCFCLALAGSMWTFHVPLRSQQVGEKVDDKKPDEEKVDDKKPAGPALDKLDEDYLRRANLETDGPSLVKFFQKRTLPEKDRPELERLV